MSPTRQQESRVRLETLGRLSDCYSDVASEAGLADFDDQGKWSSDSDASLSSTVAVVYHKPQLPSPGYQVKTQSTVASVSSGAPSTGGKISDGKEICESPAQTLRTSQLRPAKSLPRGRHPKALTPGAARSRPASIYDSDDEQPPVPKLPPSTGTGSKHPRSLPTLPVGREEVEHPPCLRPGSAMSSNDCYSGSYYRPSTSNQVSSQNRPHNFTPYSRTAPLAAQASSQSIHPNNHHHQTNSRNRSSSSRPPSIASTTCSATSRGRGRLRRLSWLSSACSLRSRSPSPSPSPGAGTGTGTGTAYGAWSPESTRRQRKSFLHRAQERIERGVHEHLVKAGLRPLPDFKVNGVEKGGEDIMDLMMDAALRIGNSNDDESESESVIVPVAVPSLAGIGGVFENGNLLLPRPTSPKQSLSPPQEKEKEKEKETPRTLIRNESWEISSGSESEAEMEMKILFIKPRHKPRLVDVLPKPKLSRRTGTPDLRINTNVSSGGMICELETPANYNGYTSAAELETPANYSHNHNHNHNYNYNYRTLASPVELEAPLQPSSFSSSFVTKSGQGKDEEKEIMVIAELEASTATPAIKTATKPLNHAKTWPGSQSQSQSQSQSSTNLCLDLELEQEQEPKDVVFPLPRTRTRSRSRSSTALSREQVCFAALPSPMEDLRCPFPFDDSRRRGRGVVVDDDDDDDDDRRDLPSQSQKGRGSGGRERAKTLSRKKGMQLRV